jgi:hypothetical protein
MAYRKNVKRIDPRYFLNETVERNDDGSVLEEEFEHPRLATQEDWAQLPPAERILRRIRQDSMEGDNDGDLARRLLAHHEEGGDITQNYHTQPGRRWGDAADGGAGKQVYTV